MHEFILWIFKQVRNLEKFLRLVFIFIIMMIAVYWFQNLLGVDWKWLHFIKPLLDWILNTADSIYSFSFDFWGKTMELKYFSAVTILFIITMSLNVISFVLEFLQNLYDDAHRAYKKANEKMFNYNMKKEIDIQEKQQSKFMVFIQTKVVTTRHSESIKGFDIYEQNRLMNKFITERMNVIPTETMDGFLYSFNDIEKLDRVLDLLFKIKENDVPVSYLVCIQVGTDIEQLKKIISLQHWNKITLAADTLYRYSVNASHRYETSSLGVFQKEGGTLELHEFVNNIENE